MSFGVTPTGFAKKSLNQIQQETDADFRGKFGDGINLDPQSPLGVLKGIIDAQIMSLWELGEAVYLSQYPGSAEGVNLDNVVALTGITRLGATKSTCETGKARGDYGTVIPAETVISVLGNPLARFKTVLEATISIAAVNEVQTITYSATPDAGAFTLIFGALETVSMAFNASNGTIQAALETVIGAGDVVVTGSFAAGHVITFGSDQAGKNQPLLNVGANTLTNSSNPVTPTIVETTQGDLATSPAVNLIAESPGAVQAPTGSLTVIETPVVGLDEFINEGAADVGNATEIDSALKLRRAQELELSGVATLNAIRAHLLTVADVDAAFVFENSTDVTDGLGRPPHSVDAIVQGGTEADIGAKLFDSVAAGIGYYGSTTVVVTDSQGFTHDVKFSRPSEVQIYLALTITHNALYPADGDAQLKAALVVYGLTLTLGEDLVVYGTKSVLAAITAVPGITDVAVKVGAAPIPATTTWTVTASSSSGLLLTKSTHGLVVGNQVSFTNSGGALPTGLTAGVVYWVVWKDTNTFKVSATRGGTSIAYTDAGTGTHTAHVGGLDDNIETTERELLIIQTANIAVTS